MLWRTLANELAEVCGTSTTMDFKRVQGRCEHEGISFLTITLASFGKDLQKGLDQGYVDRRLFTGFRWKGGLPLFLGGFLDRVFHHESGVLLDEPDPIAVQAVLQLTLMFSKMYLECSAPRVQAAFDQFIECEQDVRESDRGLSQRLTSDFGRVSSLLFADVFTYADREIYYGKTYPKHGPGSTAERLIGNEKFSDHTWTERLEGILPSGEHLLPNWSFYDQLESIDILDPGSEKPVRVISVPKTLKTPRIIGIEPVAMQFAQQSILPLILAGIRKDNYLHRILGFNDQTPNQRMALEGSLSGSLATLDLSEASDRVSNQHVRNMLKHWTWLSQAVDASRSRKADVPGHGVIRLSKFASMGSALCFPFEAMVFTTLIFMGIEQDLGTPMTRKLIKEYSRRVRVYGDDIIVPVDHVPSVVSSLESFGTKVNTGKSFWTGKFRESCGKEYYGGHDVSIVKVRHMFPARRQDATEVISIVSLRNQMYFAGNWKTARWLDGYIEKLVKHFPTVLPSSPVLGRHSFLGYHPERMHETLHSPLVKGYTVSARLPLNEVDDAEALLKFLLSKERSDYLSGQSEQTGLPTGVEDHLRRSGRPHAVNLKLGWSSAI